MEDKLLTLIGLDQTEIQNRVVKELVRQLLYQTTYNEDGDACEVSSEMATSIKKAAKDAINTAVDKIAQEQMVSKVEQLIQDCTLQKTNEWGEKVGNSLTFTEYLVSRADFWLKEPVDHNGKPKSTQDSYNWKSSGTRIAYMIDKYLQYTIENAMKGAMQNANKSIAGGILKAIEFSLAEVLQKLKVEVKTQV